MASKAEDRRWSRTRHDPLARTRTKRDRRRQLYVLGGVVGTAVVVVAALIAVNSIHRQTPSPPVTPAVVTEVQGLVAGWTAGTAQSGTTWGKRNALVTDTEYIDPQCAACDQEFVGASRQLGPLGQLSALIRSGLLKIDFVPRRTVTPSTGMLDQEWAAVLAAAEQRKAIQFLFTNYAFQPPEDSGNYTQRFIEAAAQATPGLHFKQWQITRTSPGVLAAARAAVARGDASRAGGTPTAVFSSAIGRRVVSGVEPATVYGRAVRALSP